MGKFITTKGITYFLDELIKTSKSYVYIVTPYFKIDTHFSERLLEGIKKGIQITFIYGKDINQIENLSKELRENLHIYYYSNLHAKFYMNESILTITSMNLHSYSQNNNREVGVVFTRENLNDLEIINSAIEEFESLKINSINLSSDKNKMANAPLHLTRGGNDFKIHWREYIDNKLGKLNFKKVNSIEQVLDFPIKDINFSLDYGFATFRLNTDEKDFEKIKTDMKMIFDNDLSNYRIYWNNPDMISIYPGKDTSFININEELNYCFYGMMKIIDNLKKMYDA